jgi:hypothetical protein
MNEDSPNGSPYEALAKHDQSEMKRDKPSTPPPPPTDKMGMDIAMEIDPDLRSQGGIADKFNQITESFGRQASRDDNDGSEGMPSVISIHQQTTYA